MIGTIGITIHVGEALRMQYEYTHHLTKDEYEQNDNHAYHRRQYSRTGELDEGPAL